MEMRHHGTLGLPGRASEGKRQELKFLQFNLERRKDAQDLLMQTVGKAGGGGGGDVLLISDQ